MKDPDPSLDHLPQELVMTVLFPFFDMSSLHNLSLSNKTWNQTVAFFLKDFNKTLHLVNPSHYLLHFAASQAAKLVKLELNWNTGEKSDNDLLNNILLNNKVSLFYSNKYFIRSKLAY